ncbi:DUF2149 domain-containing protein [Ectothiorhodospiraceae bacterium WFHF3C12]|nr:DUF2149 domain-containing protein [Ectothiorhodospiraceae bacterium WFHF3C12]
MKHRNFTRSRFDAQEEEPLGPMANLVDLMLVFACGLIAALVAQSGTLQEHFQAGGRQVEQGREMPEVPRGVGEAGSGYESVGRVYRDPKTGKLILVGDQDN